MPTKKVLWHDLEDDINVIEPGKLQTLRFLLQPRTTPVA